MKKMRWMKLMYSVLYPLLPCHVDTSDNVAVNDISGLENWTGQIYGAAEAVIAQTLIVPFLHQRSAY